MNIKISLNLRLCTGHNAISNNIEFFLIGETFKLLFSQTENYDKIEPIYS